MCTIEEYREIIAKRKIRDSVFTKLFKDKKNLVKLYKTLKPEESVISARDISVMTIELVLTKGVHNDLGFSIRGRDGNVEKIVLVEAQTKWDRNMAERMSMYAQRTREMHWGKNGQHCHDNIRMNTPVFEHYVVYTGDGGNTNEYMMLHDGVLPKQSMNLGIKVITKVDDSICGQYIGFCKVYNECLRKYKDNKSRVLDETINICFERGYLVEFLKDNLWEVKDIMGIFMNQALAVEQYGVEKERKGKEEGIEIGEKRGIKIGERKGKEEGIEIGEKRGIKIGKEEGIEIGEKRGRRETLEETIKMFFTGKMPVEMFAQNMGMTVDEFISTYAKRVKIEKEDFVKMCAGKLGMTIEEYKNVCR